MQRDEIKGIGRFTVGLFVLGVLLAGFAVHMAGPRRGGDDEGGGSSSELSGVTADMAGARTIFTQRCVTCHGERGEGNGPGSAGLSPAPRNFTDPAWQDEVSNEHIERIIVSGGAAVGRSAAMPNNPDLRGRPEVVAGLREIIRGFRAGN